MTENTHYIVKVKKNKRISTRNGARKFYGRGQPNFFSVL